MADGIVAEFGHRPWRHNVVCRWDAQLLWLEADNVYDSDSKALLDELLLRASMRREQSDSKLSQLSPVRSKHN